MDDTLVLWRHELPDEVARKTTPGGRVVGVFEKENLFRSLEEAVEYCIASRERNGYDWQLAKIECSPSSVSQYSDDSSLYMAKRMMLAKEGFVHLDQVAEMYEEYLQNEHPN